ncbi:MAG: hypothetical protein ACTSPK_02070 [Candidatus Heimdallarchaeota archaeon]
MKPFASRNRIFGIFFFGLLITTIGSIGLVIYPVSIGNQVIFVQASEPALDTEIIVYWNKTYSAPFVEEAHSIIKHPAVGYVVAGWTNSSGAGDLDIFVMRIADDGTPIWNKTIGSVGEDKGYQIINCAAGGFAVASTFYNTSALHNNSDFLVTRIANDGTTIWNRTYSGPAQTDVVIKSDLGRSLVECPNGDLALAGTTLDVSNGCEVWLIRINSTGTRLWEQTYTNREIDRCFSPHSLVRCSDGGFAISGYTYNSTTSNDVWLIKTDSLGIHQWNKTFGDDAGYQRPEGLVQCADGGFGIIANTHTFSAGGADAWVIRTDASGNQLWNQTYGGTEEDSGGYIMEMADGGFTIGGGTHNDDLGNGDAWILRTAENGTLFWNHTVGDPYGNGMTSFVYDGNNTYTCAGSTLPFGEVFSDIWIFKCHIIIIPQITTPTSTSPTNVGSLPGWLFTINLFVFYFIIKKIRKRK